MRLVCEQARSKRLARTIHEDASQTQQLVAWRCFVDSGPGVDPVGSSRTTEFAKCHQATVCEVWGVFS